MYNIKKNSSRKDCCKYTKSSHFKKKQNTTYFQRNKYNKYKSRYNHSNKFSNNLYEYEYENNSFYEKDSEKTNSSIKKNELIEINENKYIYEDENKENSSLYENSTVHELQIQEKTNEKSSEKNNNEEDKISEQDLNDSYTNNTIILPNTNTNSYCKTNSQICSEDKENIEPNIQYNNCNSMNISNDYFNKNLSSINLSSQDFNEAFYVPKRLNNLYAMYSNNNKINPKERNQCDNSNNILQNSSSSMSLNPSFDFNSIFQNNNNNNIQNIDGINLLLNKNNLFCNQKLNINNFPSLDLIHPFNIYDSYNNKSFRKMNSYDSFHSSLKTQMSGSFIENEKERENTDILEINVKISEKNSLVFKIRRYDDMFKTVKIFCEINKLDTKLIRPLIIYIIKALNAIYGIYNLGLKSEEIRLLKDIKEYFYNDEKNNPNYEEKMEKSERDNSIKNIIDNKDEMNHQDYLKRRNENTIIEDVFANYNSNNDNYGD
jgi:hypothetical protein